MSYVAAKFFYRTVLQLYNDVLSLSTNGLRPVTPDRDLCPEKEEQVV